MRDIGDCNCISRRLWWGHRIPAWYDNDAATSTLAVPKDAEVRRENNLGADTFS